MRIALILSVVIFISCSTKKLPDDILPPEKMEMVFWDILRADIYTTDFISVDSTKVPLTENIRLQKKIFQVHNTTKEQFYKSFDYYAEHPGLMNTILDSMIKKGNIPIQAEIKINEE